MDGEPNLGLKLVQNCVGKLRIHYGRSVAAISPIRTLNKSISRLFAWILGFSGYLVPSEHVVPVAEFLGQVLISEPTTNPVISLCRSYSCYKTSLNATNLILVTLGQAESAGIQQVAYGPKARMPYGVTPTQCPCGRNPLNWNFNPKHPPKCQCGRTGSFTIPADTRAYQDTDLYISPLVLT